MNKENFLWGVATSAYQSEGGYNGPGQPQTNWAVAERTGDVAVSGATSEFWTRYESDFATCRRLGLNAFRLGVEWSRVQPSTAEAATETIPPFDFAALDQYAEILATARRNGLEPVVTLHHFVHPAWLGTDPWLAGQRTVELFDAFVEVTVRHVNTHLASAGLEPVRYYLTVNEPNMLAINSYVARQFPVGNAVRLGLDTMVRAYDTLLAAHIAAYNTVHDLYAEAGWPAPRVTLNTYCSDVYWLDKFLLDLLCLRERNVPRGEEGAYLRGKAVEFNAALQKASLPLRRDIPYVIGSVVRGIVNWLGPRVFRHPRFPLTLEAIHASPRERLLDYIALDYYDPFFAHLCRVPDWRDLEYKTKTPQAWLTATVTSKWWDWRVLPQGMSFFCGYYSADFDQRAVLIAENGMAIRCKPDQTGYIRRDGTSRSQYLTEHVAEALRVLQAGIPLCGYLHWSLFDNYEWGSFTPRFGLYAIDYRHDAARQTADCSGDRAAETYARLIADARAALHEKIAPIEDRREVMV